MTPPTSETGYAHPGYASSLAEWGTLLALPASGGHVLERSIPGSSSRDALGPYPLFSCRDWSGLRDDLEGLAGELVSLTLVTDPFGSYDEELLRECFGDLVVPFKEHFVADLDAPERAIVSKHHRYYSRRALARVRVEVVDEPRHLLDEWTGLYAGLARRHGLDGIRAFSREAFACQLDVPGLVMLRALDGAKDGGGAVAMHLWYLRGEVAYSHLAASSARGYELMAAYALYWTAIRHFSGRVRWLDLGASAGSGGADGLARFKKGWSTGSRTAYLCGRVLDPARYSGLSRQAGLARDGYFPAYRVGEFGRGVSRKNDDLVQ